jgi:hypothetical protein
LSVDSAPCWQMAKTKGLKNFTLSSPFGPLSQVVLWTRTTGEPYNHSKNFRRMQRLLDAGANRSPARGKHRIHRSCRLNAGDLWRRRKKLLKWMER